MGLDDATGSYLSHDRYRYDFVVATTQASINSGLKAWLSKSSQPIRYFCFLADEAGDPTVQTTLDDVLNKTGGIDPFTIPHGTATSDPRIVALTKARFAVGFKMQMGLPRGVPPKNLPVIADLVDEASNVTFNLLCSEFVIIQNTPGSSWTQGSWDVWTQGPGDAWYFETQVSLLTADLSKDLNTPYFNNHPDVKRELQNKLRNLSGTAFSLQQLLLDLSTAKMKRRPSIQGLPPGSKADLVLQRSFISIYAENAMEQGLPLLSVTAVVQKRDPSPLEMTDFERQVSPLKSQGAVIKNPTPEQRAATTLDHLCAVQNKTLPPTAGFEWNWVGVHDVTSQSGTISINRSAIGEYLRDQIVRTATKSCLIFECDVSVNALGVATYGWKKLPATAPDSANITQSGSNVIQIEYYQRGYDEDRCALGYADLGILSEYKGDVTFSGTSVVVKQIARVNVSACWSGTREAFDAFKLTATDTYKISVDQYGALKMTHTGRTETDDSQDPDVSGIVNFFTGVGDLCRAIKKSLANCTVLNIEAVPFHNLQNFVFPGSLVFTYNSAQFSEHQDLISSITYLDPRRSQRKKQEGDLAIAHTSDLMQNYVRGEIVSPTGKFEALQTSNGLSLLFSLDTHNVFRVIVEQSGTTATGWKVRDLSSQLLRDRFLGQNATVRHFGVAQSALDGSINMAMAVSADGTDTLFVSLQNDSSDMSWTEKPKWTPVPFDAIDSKPISITVAGILFAETTELDEYLVVDIDRPDLKRIKNIVRYHIDISRSTGRFWLKRDVPIDIENGSYQSCVGRQSRAYVDGVYTAGRTADMPQLVYVPLVNVWGQGPPLPIRLGLPGGVLPSAIATARYGSHSSRERFASTDLYAVSGTTLYRFAADAQSQDANGVPVVTSDVLSETTTLMAMTDGDVTTLWGKNGSNNVYYVSCETAHLAEPGSWSTPVPILTGIEHISAYMNLADGGNTIFATGGGKLVKLTQASRTMAKIWRPQEIKLEAPPHIPSAPVKSYTTTIHVTDPKANHTPVADIAVSVAADSRSPVYINGLYYVLGQAPTEIKTDSTGAITIVEATEDLNAAALSVSVPGANETEVINPMDIAAKKLTDLDSYDSLRNATVPETTTAGGVVGRVKRRPLVDSSVSRQDMETVAANLKRLKEVPASLPDSARSALPLQYLSGYPRVVPAQHFSRSLNDIGIAIGDLFRWLASGVEAVIDIIFDAVTDAWHFVAKIAGKVYRAILDTVDAIVGAIKWVFDKIKTAVGDLVRFVQFLFEWDDIRRAKDVIHNVTKLTLHHFAVDGLKTAKTQFDESFAKVEKTLNQWADIGDWSPLGPPAETPAQGSTVSPVKDHTSGSLLLANQFRNNAQEMTFDVPADVVLTREAESLIDILLDAVSKEGQALSTVYAKLQQVARDFKSKSVGDVLKAIAAILADGLLSSVQVVFDALVDVLASLAASAIKLLDTKVHVPVISDILNLLGIPDFSFLDLFTWIAAVGYTVVHKITYGEAPFPDTPKVRAIIAASDWKTLTNIISQDEPAHDGAIQKADGKDIVPPSLKATIFIACHATAGFSLFTGNFLNFFEAEFPTGDNPFSIPSAVMGIIAAGMQTGGDSLAAVYPVENEAVSKLSMAMGGISLTNKLFFSGPVQKLLGVKTSIIDSVLVVPQLFVTGWHFYELSKKEVGAVRSAAIVGEVSNLGLYVSRVSYAAAVNLKDPISKQIPIGIMAASNAVAGGLQTAEAVSKLRR
ncbi:hypothetical protein EYZ11_011398 [Aspergillus tanneri]|uniref:Uncharacterized protein n=1 Tax=Aspergillus tanneri TaxID=1220188 RepID=A0A4S3J531_9EURO|nr:hypothetical protein EYZ11_011398 [Aspergillus tanneri]